MHINPEKIIGRWDEGYVLDKHIEHSELIGEDEYGRPEFKTRRTALGELIYQFKYRGRRELLSDIMCLIQPFILGWKKLSDVTFVFPAPASVPRNYQPAGEIAYEVAAILGAKFADDILIKLSHQELKRLPAKQKQEAISNTIVMAKSATKPHDILLIDDLYETGTTLNECARVLRNDRLIGRIYVLAMTRTREGGQ